MATRASAQATTGLASVNNSDTPANAICYGPAISGYGEVVVFPSLADNLVAGDTNGLFDVFRRDRVHGTITRVSVASDGAEGNGNSYSGGVTGDGRYVAFDSQASNLVAGDNNGAWDVFVHDASTGATTRVSVDSAGNEGDANSGTASISADGRYVAFESVATNLVAGDTNGFFDIFVHDRVTGATTRVSVDTAGNQSNGDSYNAQISADGRWVAFESGATNLVAGDTNGHWDVFVHDRLNATTIRVSLGPGGVQADNDCLNPAISGDGAYVTYDSGATNLVAADTNGFYDVFVYDRAAATTTRVSVDSAGAQGNGDSSYPTITADGRRVGFESQATNLVAGDTNNAWDVFLHDQATAATTRVSLSSAGAQGDADSGSAALALDGSTIAFGSTASNFATVPAGVAQDYTRSPLVTNTELLMYRAYNTALLDHFFTTRQNEFQAAVAAGFVDESTGHPGQLFRVLQESLPGLNRAVHRLYNGTTGRHYYTYKDAEMNNLVAAGWVFERDEGYIFASQQSAPMFNSVEVLHLYNTVVGSHLFTISAAEAAYVVANIPNWVQQTSLGWAKRNVAVVRQAADAVDPGSSVIRAAQALSGVN
ncbi:MAG: hypothetical protein KQJ78_19785 [Deltaproteobacteria bacterium]|nr:hypothetical protein [Deltaproteobacteria bacterium]